MSEHYYVYILTKARNSTFYTGVTNNLARRVWKHKEGVTEGFTKKYGIHQLAYYEIHSDIQTALHPEKLVKKWKRLIKMEAIESINPQWNDLYNELIWPDPVIRRGDS